MKRRGWTAPEKGKSFLEYPAYGFYSGGIIFVAVLCMVLE